MKNFPLLIAGLTIGFSGIAQATCPTIATLEDFKKISQSPNTIDNWVLEGTIKYESGVDFNKISADVFKNKVIVTSKEDEKESKCTYDLEYRPAPWHTGFWPLARFTLKKKEG